MSGSPANPPRAKPRRRPRAAEPVPKERRCSKCGRLLPMSEFKRAKRYRYGRMRWCRDCHNAHSRQWWKRNPELGRASLQRYRRKNRQKEAAWFVVHWAVRAGVIEKPDRCERCGTKPPPRRLHAHHPDYSKALDVVWLCSRCHGLEHRRDA